MKQKVGEKDVDIKRIQALKWMSQKIDNMSTKEIAEQAGVSHDTVTNRLSWAKRAGIFTDYEDKLLSELIPAAHRAILSALEDGDAAVALEIYKGQGFLSKGQSSSKKDNPKVTQLSDGDEEDLASYMRKLRNQAQEQEDRIEGTVMGQVKLLTEGIEQDEQLESVSGSVDGGPVEADDQCG